MKVRCSMGCLTVFFLGLLNGQSAYVDSLYGQANRLYRESDYAQAANGYDRIVRQGYAHPDLYYNLGNAYYQLGRLGDAIWAFEKGLQLNPRDPDLKFNLSVARARTADRVEIPEPLLFLKWYREIKTGLSPREWLSVMGALFFLSALIFLGSRFLTGRRRTASVRAVAVGLVLTVLSALVFADVYYDVSEKREAIVVIGEGEVVSAPTGNGELLFVVHEGTKAEITGLQDGWAEIQLVDGKKGWIPDEALRRL